LPLHNPSATIITAVLALPVFAVTLILILDEMEINNIGMCESCIVVSLNPDFLEAEKEQQLRNIESCYKNINI